MPESKKSNAFNGLSNEEKAKLFKLHLAFQFIKRPNLTNDQRDIILDGITVTTADSYDKENIEKAKQDSILLESRAKSAFQGLEAFEIFASLSGNSEDVQSLKQLQAVTSYKYQVERRDSFRKLNNEGKSEMVQ